MSFTTWLLKRSSPVPEADRLVQLIQRAGRPGIEEGPLRAAVDLPKAVVDDLLRALVAAGTVGVVESGRRRWYFIRS
jgi:hypothetical protein